jgi:uncharacterized membrane protein YgaE (UPF0421/DUF939 family)
MITDKELEKLIKESKKTNGELTKEQKEDNIIEWTDFYRKNFNIFIEDYLKIKISFFQKQRIMNWQRNDINMTLASRGSAK